MSLSTYVATLGRPAGPVEVDAVSAGHRQMVTSGMVGETDGYYNQVSLWTIP